MAITLVDLFGREIRTGVPGHLFMTMKSSKNKELGRFIVSDPSIKMSIVHTLKDWANEKFNSGCVREALTLYNGVRLLVLLVVPENHCVKSRC